ncbi:MAG TPA: HAMP domain-containing sensor histidine kinase [Gemmatimonadaceae bacterium]|nr:HAMP domain-containing sensor histidine kinase [Gemmatimonadaceae bacterium]
MTTDDAPVAPQDAREAEAAAAIQARNTFLTIVSHELRTPLTALTGYGELLSDGILGPLTPLQHDTIERMRAVTQQLSVMIDGMLTFSNIEAGHERVVITQVSPSHVLRSAAAILEPLVRKKAVELVVRADDTLLPIPSDEEKIRQILVHLGGNAVKFTVAGRVCLSVEGRGDEVVFVVEDTGCGIADGDWGRLFRPFTQLDAGLTKRHGGSGLGLYISSRLAGLLGGRIDVASTVGVGSVFTLRLPRVRRAAAESGSR